MQAVLDIADCAGDDSTRLMHEAQSELVRNVQRAWIISAVAKLVCEQGPETISVRQIVERAGVSRRRFYELFANADDGFLAAFEQAVEQATERAVAGYRLGEAWADRLRSALSALLAFFEAEPELARLSVLHTTPAGSATPKRNAILARLAQLIDAGGRTDPRALNPPPLTAESVVGGVLAVLQTRLMQDEHDEPLTSLVSPLMSVIVLPYVGPVSAWHELSRPVTSSLSPRLPSTPASDPLAGLEMRMSYRTLRVLGEIAAAPGISNQRVADAAGVRDAGQISKLLSRLEGLELIRNSGAGHAKGRANAWTLTSKGADLGRSFGSRLQSGAWTPSRYGRDS